MRESQRRKVASRGSTENWQSLHSKRIFYFIHLAGCQDEDVIKYVIGILLSKDYGPHGSFLVPTTSHKDSYSHE